MKKVIYYEANDGKRFESEGECAQYEFNKDFEKITEMLMMWDDDGEKIKITYHTDLERAYAIYCSSITAAIFLKKWGEKDRILTPYSNIDIEGCGEAPLGKFIYFNDEWNEINEIVTLFEKINRQMDDGEQKIFIPLTY